jgi:hypothetical protein
MIAMRKVSDKMLFEWEGLMLYATYTYTPGDPGRCSGPPEKCYPPEGAEVEINKLTYNDQDVMFLWQSDLGEDIADTLVELIEENLYDDRDEGPEDHFRDDVEADADTLRSAGMGTDEDYGDFGDNHGY